MICREWVHTNPLPDSLQEFNLIEVTVEEAEVLGCNICVIDENKIVLPDQQLALADRIKAQLDDNLDVIWIDYENVVQLGGGLRCSHHPLVRESTL